MFASDKGWNTAYVVSIDIPVLGNSTYSSQALPELDGVGHFFEKMYAGYEFDRVATLTAEWLERTLASR